MGAECVESVSNSSFLQIYSYMYNYVHVYSCEKCMHVEVHDSCDMYQEIQFLIIPCFELLNLEVTWLVCSVTQGSGWYSNVQYGSSEYTISIYVYQILVRIAQLTTCMMKQYAAWMCICIVHM